MKELSIAMLPPGFNPGADMKFNAEILRELLLYVEEHATRPYSEVEDVTLDGRSQDDVTYHVVLAEEDGLIKATMDMLPDDTNPELVHVGYSIHRLTANGHEFLGSVREDDNWTTIKDAARKAGAVTVGAFTSVAETVIKQKIAQVLGVSLA